MAYVGIVSGVCISMFIIIQLVQWLARQAGGEHVRPGAGRDISPPVIFREGGGGNIWVPSRDCSLPPTPHT
jgi:hypothetical protein